MKINEDRKACEGTVDQLELKVNNLERQLSISDEKVATYIVKETRYKDTAVAYRISLENRDNRVEELEKQNKGLKLKLRLVIVGAAAILVKALLF